MKYYCLKNLSMLEVSTVETQDLSSEKMGLSVPKTISDKEHYMSWVKSPMTDHCFYSVLRGTNCNVRVSKDNLPTHRGGFIADYDSQIDPDEKTFKEIVRRGNPNCLPTYFTRTFSGNARLVWIFEEEMPFFSRDFDAAFVKNFLKVAKVKSLLPGFDETGLDYSHYFELGTLWTRLGTEKGMVPPVSRQLLWFWEEGISSKLHWNKEGIVVPMDKIVEELEERFPGRWRGHFDIGKRGCRFWDDGADNHTSAIVRSSGMQCFTGDKPFMTWYEIFGSKFIEKFRSDRIGDAIANIWYDGEYYWRQMHDQVWRDYTKENMALYLAHYKGLANAKGEDEMAETKRALATIQEIKIVDAALPVVGWSSGIVYFNNRKVLNTSRTRPVSPAMVSYEDAGKRFPFTLRLIQELFGEEALPYLVAWLKRFYTSFYECKPLKGQAVFIAGAVGVGKTFFTNIVIGKLLGGIVDASDFLMGKTQFNKELLEYAVWGVDDSSPSADPRWHLVYSAMVKRVAANHAFQYNAKFRDTHTLPWNGRILVSCNDDPESMRVLPDTDLSVLDKLNLFRVSKPQLEIPHNGTDIVAQELPFLARWLLEHVTPEHVRGTERFGTACYHDKELLAIARKATRSNTFLELLEMFLFEYFKTHEVEEWIGSSTDMMAEMFSYDKIKELAKQHSPVAIGRALGQLMGQGKEIRQVRAPGGDKRVWSIPKKLIENMEG